MSEELADARARLEDAQRQKDEADALIEALEQQVVDGQDEVVVLEAGQQYGMQRLAELQRQRAQKQVQAAEAAALEERRGQALAAAGADLSGFSMEVIAQKYGAALAALDDLAAACDAREAAIVRHRVVFEQLGMDGSIPANTPHQRIIEVSGERFEEGACKAELMASRVVARLSRVRSFRQLIKASNIAGGYHQAELILTGLSRERARLVEESSGLAAPLVEAAHAAAQNVQPAGSAEL